jgi:methionine sulfoxide reductase heme-binding subunit
MQISSRLKSRLLKHHLVLALTCTAAVLAIHGLLAPAPSMFRWSMATAYVGLCLLGATLMLGPINVLRARPHPLSADVRRDIGIWCAIVSTLHVVVGLQVHLGDPLRYFFDHSQSTALALRTDAFGFANHSGLVASLLLLMLLALSNDASLRKLGRNAWKRLQRSSYAVAVLVFLHGVIYQLIEKRASGYVVLLVAFAATVAVLQWAAMRLRRSQLRTGNATLGAGPSTEG